ncbi:pathogenesis-related BetVI family protein, partial [Latilactobacillus sakei]|uniref:pathogenesis-related BetVI family protein n=1 Tax=Latilactobacillus sakei TaxID=1599 RepID=UPI003F52C60E
KTLSIIMGVFTYEDEITSTLPPVRVFKGFLLNADEIIPKVAPQAVKQIEVLEGDGGPGTVKKITFGDGGKFKYVKHRVDLVDKDNLTYGHSLIEGDVLLG